VEVTTETEEEGGNEENVEVEVEVTTETEEEGTEEEVVTETEEEGGTEENVEVEVEVTTETEEEGGNEENVEVEVGVCPNTPLIDVDADVDIHLGIICKGDTSACGLSDICNGGPFTYKLSGILTVEYTSNGETHTFTKQVSYSK